MMAEVKFPDVKAIVDSFTDLEASTRQTVQKVSDFYAQAIKDIRQLDDDACIEYLERMNQIAEELEKVASRDVDFYRYFLYGVFRGQINVTRNTILREINSK